MTSDRDFKRLVRDRVRRTGESYSTARARLIERRDRAKSTPVDPSGWRTLEVPGLVMKIPRGWVDLGITAEGEVAHLGPPRSIFSGVAALFGSLEGASGWMHDVANPFGGVRLFRYDVGLDAGVSVADARERGMDGLRAGGFNAFAEGERRIGSPVALEFSCSRTDRLGRRWSLRQTYVRGNNDCIHVVIVATFDPERDRELIETLLGGLDLA